MGILATGGDPRCELSRLSLNLIEKEEQYSDWAIKKRRLAASLDPNYLGKLLGLGL